VESDQSVNGVFECCLIAVHPCFARGASKWSGEKSMVEMSKRVPIKKSDTLKIEADDSKKPVTAPKSRAEKSADTAAHKSSKTQQEYEQDRTIISK
jgi:hypothetical protein